MRADASWMSFLIANQKTSTAIMAVVSYRMIDQALI